MLTSGNLERETVQHAPIAEPLGDVIDFEEHRAGHAVHALAVAPILNATRSARLARFFIHSMEGSQTSLGYPASAVCMTLTGSNVAILPAGTTKAGYFEDHPSRGKAALR